MKITAETNYFEIKYEKDGYTYTTTISAGIIDDKDVVMKFIRKKYKGIELVQITKLNM
mgnify:CR=1 FL=1